MRRRYYASFHLGQLDEPPPALEDVFDTCRRWIFHPGRELQAPDDFAFAANVNRTETVGDGVEVSLRSYEEESSAALGVRFEHPDHEDTELRWRTDICCFREPLSGLQCAVTLSAGHEGIQIAPSELPVSRPRVVPSLVERFGAHANRTVSADPKSVEHTGEFVSYLLDPDRALPVVFISALQANDKPVVNTERIADRLVGIAHVHVAPNRFVSFDLTDLVGKSLSCWNGALRIYWPGFTKAAHPYNHRLWTPRDLIADSRDIATELLYEIAGYSLNRLPPEKLRWESFDQHEQRVRFEQLRDEGEQEELLDYADRVIKEQKATIDHLEEELQNALDKADAERRRANSFREAMLALQRGAEDEEDRTTVAQAPPTAIDEAVERIEEEFPHRVAFPLNNRSEVDGNPFTKIEEFYGALRFLATTYWEARTGMAEKPVADFSHACQKECGFFYRSTSSDVTMGRYPDYYLAEWKGERVPLAAHLGKGSGKDPRHTIRIAFHWDEDDETVVVGYIGQHQRTQAT